MQYIYRKNERHLIENYADALKDNFKGWDLHHRLEFTIDDDLALSSKDLRRLEMYYNRPYYELIYLKHSDHIRLHMKKYKPEWWKTHSLTSEHQKKMAAGRKGKIRGTYKLSWSTWYVGPDGKRVYVKKE